MDLDTLRGTITDKSLDILGRAATVTLPLENPVESRIHWMRNLDEDLPAGKSYSALGARRRMAIKRNEFSDIPRGTIVAAPDPIGGEVTNWQVDGIEEVTRAYFVVVVVPETGVI